MREFEKILLRLKETLGVQTDKEVAGLLNLSVKAFTSRKLRNSFPEDKLLALKSKRPDLGIDDVYILTGHRSGYVSVMEDAKRHWDELKVDSLSSVEEPANVKTFSHLGGSTPAKGEMTAQEIDLIINYRAATEKGKLAIEITAQAVEKTKK